VTTDSNGSNGSNGHAFIPKIGAETQRLLDRHRENRMIEFTIQDSLGQVVDALVAEHRDHLDVIVRCLEGCAQEISRQKIKADKEKQRNESSTR
jgi:hypothetical protein